MRWGQNRGSPVFMEPGKKSPRRETGTRLSSAASSRKSLPLPVDDKQ